MSWTTVLGRVTGFLVGLFIVIVGFSLFTKESGLTHTGQVTALISVLIALGIGVMAASLLPNTITIEGKEVKPLGLGLNATGGAGFFIITLIFLFYFDGKSPEPEPGKEGPEVIASGAPDPAPTATPPANPKPSTAPSDTSSAAPVGLASGAVPLSGQSTPAPAYQQPQQSYYRVQTYCSICCPQGPQNCAQVGYGESYSLEEAALQAAQMCVANQGYAESCTINLTQY